MLSSGAAISHSASMALCRAGVGFDLSDQMNAGGGGLLEDGVDGPNGISVPECGS